MLGSVTISVPATDATASAVQQTAASVQAVSAAVPATTNWQNQVLSTLTSILDRITGAVGGALTGPAPGILAPKPLAPGAIAIGGGSLTVQVYIGSEQLNSLISRVVATEERGYGGPIVAGGTG